MILRFLFALAVMTLLIAAVAGYVALSAGAECSDLVEAGYNVVLVERTCFADIGGGMYVAIHTHEQPKTLHQIKAEMAEKKNAPLFP